MTKIIIITSVFFLVMYMRNAVTMGSDVEQKRKVDDVKYSHLWFGPRVGRRKRNPSDDLIKSIDGSDIQNVLNYIKKNPWTIMLMSAGKKQPFHFLLFGFNIFICSSTSNRPMFSLQLFGNMNFTFCT